MVLVHHNSDSSVQVIGSTFGAKKAQFCHPETCGHSAFNEPCLKDQQEYLENEAFVWKILSLLALEPCINCHDYFGQLNSSDYLKH